MILKKIHKVFKLNINFKHMKCSLGVFIFLNAFLYFPESVKIQRRELQSFVHQPRKANANHPVLFPSEQQPRGNILDIPR